MHESFFDKLSQQCIPANKHDYCFLMGDLNFGKSQKMQRNDTERVVKCKSLYGVTLFFSAEMIKHKFRPS
ncbi:MAG: hypothetical protein EZS28_031540 [Streblomastix strix]|uniref:Uncharacterized protein n=1 Tax=Streblomastix strix TaxID=222440 RepID=A0A5J4URG2_9EUKA|nr:MAG: hypothetical protein EZS28_031540 [Streblomastix strix]